MVNIVSGSNCITTADHKILLFGGSGLIGHALQLTLGESCLLVSPSRGECDITDRDAVHKSVMALKPNMIINAAAFTSVDRAESIPEAAFLCNDFAVENIGLAAENVNCPVVHFSTDYVFDGHKVGAYFEQDSTNALNVYGASKAAGEFSLKAANSRAIIIRTSWLYGAHRPGFIDAVLKQAAARNYLKIPSDQIGAPTSAKLVALVTKRIVLDYLRDFSDGTERQFPFGTYHLTCSGAVSRLDYARAIVTDALEAGLPLVLSPSGIQASSDQSSEYAATRPLNSRLDCSKLEEVFKLELPYWRGTLKSFISKRPYPYLGT